MVFTETKSKGFSCSCNRMQRQPPSHLTLAASCTGLAGPPDTPQGSEHPALLHTLFPSWKQNQRTQISNLGRGMDHDQ